MSLKSIWSHLLVLVLCFSFAACSVSDTDTGAAADIIPEDAVNKVKIRIISGMGGGFASEQVEAQQALADKFNAVHEKIEIEFLIGRSDADQRFSTMMSNGDIPDLIGPGNMAVAASYLDQLADLSPLIDGIDVDMSDFYSAATELYQSRDKVFGLPLGLFPSFIFYNKDLFDAAGIDYPTGRYDDASWDMDALRQLAMSLTLDAAGNNAHSAVFDADNIVQYGLMESVPSFRALMTHFDPPGKGRPLSSDLRRSLLNSEEYVAGLTWFNDAIWQDHFMADLSTLQEQFASGVEPFSSGNTAMYYGHTWFMPGGLADLPFEYDFAAAPFSQKGTRVARIHTTTFYMVKESNNKREAFEVMQWLTGREQIVEVCLIYGCLPARLSVQNDYLRLLREQYGQHDYGVILGAVDYLDNPHHLSWMPENARVDGLLSILLNSGFSQPFDDPAATLEDINSRVQAMIDGYWADR